LEEKIDLKIVRFKKKMRQFKKKITFRATVQQLKSIFTGKGALSSIKA